MNGFVYRLHQENLNLKFLFSLSTVHSAQCTMHSKYMLNAFDVNAKCENNQTQNL